MLSKQGLKGAIRDIPTAPHVNTFLPQAEKEIIIYFKPPDNCRAPGPDLAAVAMTFPGLWQTYSWLLQLQPGFWGMFKENAAGGGDAERVRNSISSETTAATWGEFVLEPNEGEHSLLVFSPADEILREDSVILCFLSMAFHQWNIC